ncbi:hypothetical protein TNCV_3597231 [Trichonephila clavipes]|nr:hypothetical protein TNCV_3597231 [Trichonephila clavipes]
MALSGSLPQINLGVQGVTQRGHHMLTGLMRKWALLKTNSKPILEIPGGVHPEASEISKDKSWGILYENLSLVSEAPRKAAAARFRLLTGQDCTRFHLYQISIADSPDCTLWDSSQPITAEHLEMCLALNGLGCVIEKYWRTHALMIYVLFAVCGTCKMKLSPY